MFIYCVVGEQFRLDHIERVKSYAPRISHFVYDVECRCAAAELAVDPAAAVQPQEDVSSTIRVLNMPSSRDDFFRRVVEHRKPVVLKNARFGPCLSKWDAEYLSTQCHRRVSVHVTSSPSMSFVDRNFVYRTMTFSELVERIEGSESVCHEPLLAEGEGYYMRSLAERAHTDIARFFDDYPELCEDFNPDDSLIGEQFSSILRLQSASNELWTHYDITDNLLYQIRGKKRVTLFSPEYVNDLYVESSSSRVADIDNFDETRFPRFRRAYANRIELVLHPGDVLFIPALWFHK